MTKQLTVEELIERLKDFPSDTPVEIEGCDCFNEAAGVLLEINKTKFDKTVAVIIKALH